MKLNVGRIGKAHGILGEATIEVRTDEAEDRFAIGAVLQTESHGELTVASARVHNGILLLGFEGIEDRNAIIIAVDNSDAMLKKCASILELSPSMVSTKLVDKDICEISIDNASMVVMNFTLQFIPIEKRVALIEKIYAGLNPGGCLVISEKLRFEPDSLDSLLSDLHHQFKRAQGYSELEISQKRDSIENVLIPETLDNHIQRLRACGFQSASPWFQCFNFCSLVAVK
jgi:tRNA (cmo5U34)-methyltransferase